MDQTFFAGTVKMDSNMEPKRRRCFPAVNHDQPTQNLSPSTSKQPPNLSIQHKPSDICQPTDTDTISHNLNHPLSSRVPPPRTWQNRPEPAVKKIIFSRANIPFPGRKNYFQLIYHYFPHFFPFRLPVVSTRV